MVQHNHQHDQSKTTSTKKAGAGAKHKKSNNVCVTQLGASYDFNKIKKGLDSVQNRNDQNNANIAVEIAERVVTSNTAHTGPQTQNTSQQIIDHANTSATHKRQD